MKTRTYSHVIVAVAAVAVAACAGSTDSCSTTSPCVAGEPDLAVAEVTMTGTVHDPGGLVVVQPDAIDVRIVVRNDGTATSDEKPLQIKVRNGGELLMVLAPMKPGEERTRTIHVPAPPAGTILFDTDTTSVIVSIVGLDSKRSNDQLASTPFHLALPAIRVTTTIAADILLADAPLPASVRIENVSSYTALNTATVSYCIYDLGGICSKEFRGTLFGSVAVPALAPGAVTVLDHPVVVPNAATSHNVVDAYMIGTCVSTVGGTPATCISERQVAVRPDYESCEPIDLTPDRPTRGSAACNIPCAIVAFRVNVLAGHTYRVEMTNGLEEQTLRWRTRYRDNPVDASSADGFQPETSGTVYLVTAAKYCGEPDITNEVVLRDIAPVSN